MPRFAKTGAALPHGICAARQYCVEHRQDRRVPGCKSWPSPEDGLLRLFTYHFADLLTPGAVTEDDRRRCALAAVRGKLLPPGTDPNEFGTINAAYDAFVESYGAEVLPVNWRPTYDYWGGRCFARGHGQKTCTIAAGDSGRFAAFRSFDDLKRYFAEKVAELEAANEGWS